MGEPGTAEVLNLEDLEAVSGLRTGRKHVLSILVENKPGVLATVAAAIAEAGSNIENGEYQERDLATASLLFTIEVRGRKHLADVMRRVRRAGVVHSVHRNGG